MPVPAAGELLIAVQASGVNRPDVLQRKGLYPMPPGVSDLPGLEVAGTSWRRRRPTWRRPASLGDPCARWWPAAATPSLRGAGRPVPAGAGRPERWSRPPACPRPSSPSGRTCSRSPRLQPGETLLVQGGSSGIGVTAIQLAKAIGCTVIVTAGSDEKCAACVALGADHAINYRTQDFAAEIKRLTAAAAPTSCSTWWPATTSARAAVPGRRRPLALIAVQGGTKSAHRQRPGAAQALAITGSTLRPRSVAYKTAARAGAAREGLAADRGRPVKPVIHQVFRPPRRRRRMR
jgi:NADPH:quinone reductase